MFAFLAASGALLSSAPEHRRSFRADRRAALHSVGAAALAFATVPNPVHALPVSDPQRRFEDVQLAASSSLASTSKLFEKIDTLDRAPGKQEFLFTAPSLCKVNKGGSSSFASVRLWRPTGGDRAASLVTPPRRWTRARRVRWRRQRRRLRERRHADLRRWWPAPGRHGAATRMQR